MAASDFFDQFGYSSKKPGGVPARIPQRSWLRIGSAVPRNLSYRRPARHACRDGRVLARQARRLPGSGGKGICLARPLAKSARRYRNPGPVRAHQRGLAGTFHPSCFRTGGSVDSPRQPRSSVFPPRVTRRVSDSLHAKIDGDFPHSYEILTREPTYSQEPRQLDGGGSTETVVSISFEPSENPRGSDGVTGCAEKSSDIAGFSWF